MYFKSPAKLKDGTIKDYATCQIVEAYVDKAGKNKQRILFHLGPLDKFLEKDIDNLINGMLKAKGINYYDLESDVDSAQSFGQIWTYLNLWRELKISQTLAKYLKKTQIEFNLEDHLKALVFNRLDDPGSKLKLMSWLENVYIPQIDRDNICYKYLFSRHISMML